MLLLERVNVYRFPGTRRPWRDICVGSGMAGRLVGSGPKSRWRRRQGWLVPVAAVAAGAVAVALIGSTAAQAVTSTVPAATSTTIVAGLDLNNPVANVTDPAAGLVPVDTACTSGKIDLNNASAAALRTALGVPSDPTITRLIALRPWLKGADLSSVPGIGPSLATQLAPLTCATQPPASTVPPRACTSPNQVDLNTASAAIISSKLGLASDVVTSLIAARPLPQNLSQVIAPRVPGFPQPRVDRWTQQGLICVTPAPYSSTDTTYRWATPTFGTVATSGTYALIVPAGRTTGPGAYAAVTPEAAQDGVLPRGDFHIYGDWSGEVGVQLPNAQGHTAADETVIHDAADGPRISSGNGAVPGLTPGSVLVAATSLLRSV